MPQSLGSWRGEFDFFDELDDLAIGADGAGDGGDGLDDVLVFEAEIAVELDFSRGGEAAFAHERGNVIVKLLETVLAAEGTVVERELDEIAASVGSHPNLHRRKLIRIGQAGAGSSQRHLDVEVPLRRGNSERHAEEGEQLEHDIDHGGHVD